MDSLAREIAGATAAHRALEADLAAFVAGGRADGAMQASLLPAWTVGHVLTHLARNADSHAQMLRAAAAGEPAVQYPGGRAQRDGDIVDGATRPLAEIVADLRTSNLALEAAWSAAQAQVWAASGETAAGRVPLADLPFRRWREVCVHHADLGGEYTWADWPADYVRVELQRMTMLWNSRLPMGLTGLPAEAIAASPHHRLAWLLGRAAIEGRAAADLMA